MRAKRHALRKKEAKRILGSLGVECDMLEILETEKYAVFLCDGFPLALPHGDRVIPTILALFRYRLKLPVVVVDEGAVPHVRKGANVMGPGIVDASEGISPGDVVVVLGPDRKVLAVGLARRDTGGLMSKDKGVAVENLHHVGDRVWRDFAHLLVRGLEKH